MAIFRFPALVAGLLSLSACVGVQPSFNPEDQQVFDEAVADGVPMDAADDVVDEPIAPQVEASWTASRQTSWSSTEERSSGRDFRRQVFAGGPPSHHRFRRPDRSGDGIFGHKRQESPFTAPFSSAEPARPHRQPPGMDPARPHELQHHRPDRWNHSGGGHHETSPAPTHPAASPQPPTPAPAAEPPKPAFSRPLAPQPPTPPTPPTPPAMPAMPSLSQNPATHAPHGFGGHHEHRIDHRK